jgi:hypothetical protein
MRIANQDLSKLPLELARKAIVLAGEPAWRPDDAIAVADFLANNNIAIGVLEAWRDGEAAPYFIATCDFDVDGVQSREGMPWPIEVEFARKGAIAFIQETRNKEKLIYNFHWVNQDDPPAK